MHMNQRYTDSRLRREILALFDERRQAGLQLEPQWAALQMCARHRHALPSVADDGPIAMQDAVAFWEFTGYTHARKIATACVNDIGRAHHEPEQQVFPGFEYLQTDYVIVRNGVAQDVATEDATDDELLDKANLFESQSARLSAHARELRRYVALRRAQRGDDSPHV